MLVDDSRGCFIICPVRLGFPLPVCDQKNERGNIDAMEGDFGSVKPPGPSQDVAV